MTFLHHKILNKICLFDMEDNTIPTLVIDKQNINIYQYHLDDVYENLATGKSGKVRPEDAKRWFKIPLILNAMAIKNKNIVTLIRMFGFQYEGLVSHGTEEQLKESLKL